MFSTTTFQDPIWMGYARLLAVVLIAAGLLIQGLRWRLGQRLDSVWITYRSWRLLLPPALVLIGAGRGFWIVAVFGVACLALREFARATGLDRERGMMTALYAQLIALMLVTWMPDPRLHQPGWYGLFMALPVYAIGCLLILPILRGKSRGQLQIIALSILAFIYFGWMFGHLAFLANSDHAVGYLLFLIVALPANDIAAFTFGKIFGRHKLCPEISPNKTVEGALGGLAVSLALPFLMRFSFPHFGLTQLILTGLIIGIGGQLGDLAISLIKRDLGVKDMGRAIPGHGGVLDRIDSLIFVSPLFFHMTRWFYGLSG